MKNYIQEGAVLPLTAPAGGVVAGTAYKIGSVVVVAQDDAAAGDTFQGHCKGVFDLPVDASTPTEGAKAYFVAADNNFSTTATGNTLAGAFISAKDANGNANIKLTDQVA